MSSDHHVKNRTLARRTWLLGSTACVSVALLYPAVMPTQAFERDVNGAFGSQGEDPLFGSYTPSTDGDDAGDITLTSPRDVLGDWAANVVLKAQGGDGGRAPARQTFTHAKAGGDGGKGGAIVFRNRRIYQALTDHYWEGIPISGGKYVYSSAIWANATGGKGGGSTVPGVNQDNGYPGTAGDGGSVTIQNAGDVSLQEEGYNLIEAVAKGGDGGDAEKTDLEPAVNGGNAANGGEVSVALDAGTVTVPDDGRAAVLADATGGTGGDASGSGGGGNGGDGGTTTVNIAGGVVIDAAGTERSPAVLAKADGGNGGQTGSEMNGRDPFVETGVDGGSGGDGGTVSLSSAGSVVTSADKAPGLVAHANGGNARAGSQVLSLFATGGRGGRSGDAGTVSLTNSGTVTTRGLDSIGALASSIGGNGGSGGYSAGIDVTGGQGAAGGDGGEVTLRQSGDVKTGGDHATGLQAISVGGGGGNGGGTLAAGFAETASIGGNGGGGADGGPVRINPDLSRGSRTTGSIETAGVGAIGLDARSIGGGGGEGGSAFGVEVGTLPIGTSLVFGGSGNSGGDGGTVEVKNRSRIETGGAHASGLYAGSIGGGGGAGGYATSYALNINTTPVPVGGSAAFAMGGSGSVGGDGGHVLIDNNARLTTGGDEAPGIFAQSIGGGGGNGGNSKATSFALSEGASLSLSYSHGGNGGAGGDGGRIDITNTGQIATGMNGKGEVTGLGTHADAIIAQSVGGGGGRGGSTSSTSYSLASTAHPEGNANFTPDDIDRTLGSYGYQQTPLLRELYEGEATGRQVVLSDGENAALTTVKGLPAIPFAIYSALYQAKQWTRTIGDISQVTGVGSPTATLGVSVSIAHGGNGGDGGDGGPVSIDQTGTLTTSQDFSRGILAQSIGGGGGSAGSSYPESNSTQVAAEISLGGDGGAGGDGDTVDITTNAKDGNDVIATFGDNSVGILAQSIGGGGGLGGGYNPSDRSTHPKSIAGSVSMDISQGGTGGGGGNGGDVTISNDVDIATVGRSASALVAQSIGGGGGMGGASGASDIALAGLNVNHGGDGGGGGTGGDVTVDGAASLFTMGTHADALVAQSVGGGGGYGASASGTFANLANVNLTFGGDGGGANDGGDVTVSQTATVVTTGKQATGIFAQSIGGGGGKHLHEFLDPDAAPSDGDGRDPDKAAGEVVITGPSSDADGDSDSDSGGATDAGGWAELSLGMSQAGDASSAGSAGDVSVSTLDNEESMSIVTLGEESTAIFAQSVGGGGGVGGFGQRPDKAIFNIGASGGGNGGAGGNGGDVSVSLGNGDIVTRGQGAVGVHAQSLGGGGGHAHGVQSDIGLAFNFGASGGVAGDGGDVSVIGREAAASISTAGTGAHGIVAQSNAGGGGSAGTKHGFSLLLPDFAFSDGTGGNAGDVTVDYAGTIETTGEGSIGILGVSTSPAGVGSIDITAGGDVTGGTGPAGAAVAFLGGQANSLTVKEGASLTAGDGGFAIAGAGLGGTGDGSKPAILVDNFGTVTGSLDLGRSDGAGGAPTRFVNHEGGVFNPGMSVFLRQPQDTTTRWSVPVIDGYQLPLVNDAGKTLFLDQGTLNVAGANRIGSTTLYANTYHAKGATMNVDVDAATGAHDMLTVSGDVKAEGWTIVPHLMALPGSEDVNAAQPRWTVASSRAGNVNGGDTITTVDTLAAQYETDVVEADDGKAVVVELTELDFVEAAGSDEKAVEAAEYIDGHLDGLTSASLSDITLQLANYPTGEAGQKAYLAALDSLHVPGVAHHTGSRSKIARKLADSMHSCPVFEGESTLLREERCIWSRVVGDFADTDVDGGADLSRHSLSARFGGQVALQDDWFVGGMFAYGHSRIEAADGSFESDTDDYAIGGIVKKRIDDRLELSLSATYLYGDGEQERTILSPLAGADFGRRASSTLDSHVVSARWRTAYYADFETWYAKPRVDFDFHYTHLPSTTEEGGGRFGMIYGEADRFDFAIRPGVDVGTRVDVPTGTLRPFARAGVTFAENIDYEHSLRLAGSSRENVSFTNAFEEDSTRFNLGAGVDYVGDNGIDLRLEYAGSGNSDFMNHEITARVGMRF